MDTQNKVTVKIIRKLGERPYFQVEWGKPIQFKVFSFMEDAAEGTTDCKQKNRDRAMAFAAKIENGNTDTEEIIYQTPEN